MTRRSFTLRQGGGFGPESDGSVLRPADPAAEDSGLRGDSFIYLPSAPLSAYFNAAPIAYDQVELDWNVESSVSWLELVLVASNTGHPATILDGRTVTTVSSGVPIYTWIDKGATAGAWHYYSMFAKLTDGVTNHYERIKMAECLVPFNHKSTEYLYGRVPEYYRLVDMPASNDTTEGPLHKLVGLIGWEMDYVRTLVDDVRNIRDVSKIPAQALGVLGDLLGTTPLAQGISETRYRSLLRNITHIRESKGTVPGIKAAISAVSGYQSDITIVSAAEIDIKIYAQRANLIKNPKFQAGAAQWTITPGTSVTTSTTGNLLTITNGAGVARDCTVQSNVFPVSPGRTYSAGVRLDAVPTGVTIDWSLLWDGTPATITPLQPLSVSPSAQRLTTDPLKCPNGTSTGALRLVVHMPAGAVVKLTQAIVEPGLVGQYFDGDTITGGFLPGSTGLWDYRWEGTANQSYSYYSLDFGVTQKVVMNIMPAIIPVGVGVGGTSGYAITEWSFFPGKV